MPSSDRQRVREFCRQLRASPIPAASIPLGGSLASAAPTPMTFIFDSPGPHDETERRMQALILQNCTPSEQVLECGIG